MQTQIEELTTKLQEVREKEAQCRIEFNEEAFARERLIEMYKEENESCKSKLEEATNAIGEFKQVVLELKDEYTKLADEKSTNEAGYEVQRKEHEESISKLEQELKNANEVLSIAKRKGAAVLSESDIEQLSPAAAVARRLLKSGMSLTQIYSEYVNLTEKYEQERKDKERVEAYLNQVMQEIEEKAPIFKRQKQEYEEAVKTVNNLTTQLENAMIDYEVRQVQRWPIRNSPLGALLDPNKDVARYAALNRTGHPDVVSLEVRDPRHPEYGTITMIMLRKTGAPGGLELDSWVALDSQNKRTTVRLSNQRYGIVIPANMFRWNDPRTANRK
jgi:predicted  nucleic acid-binding Zn-ribbon protein